MERLFGGSLGPGASAWSDAEGGFLIEGLEPGEYLIRAKPMARHACAPDLASNGAIFDAFDGWNPEPVAVRAGDRTEGVLLDLAPGPLGSP